MPPRQATSEIRARITPRPALLRAGILSFVSISAPLFTALYLLSIPLARWPAVVMIHIALVGLFLAAYLRYRMSFVAVTPIELRYRGFASATRSVPLGRVGSIVLARTYRSNSTDSSPELLVRDADERKLMRLRGLFWSEDDLRRVATAIDRPVTHQATPLTSREFFARYPGSEHWFENKPALTAAAIIGGIVVGFGIVIGLMAVTGIPIIAE